MGDESLESLVSEDLAAARAEYPLMAVRGDWAVMATAQLRRLYHHAFNGGLVGARDLSGVVQMLERSSAGTDERADRLLTAYEERDASVARADLNAAAVADLDRKLMVARVSLVASEDKVVSLEARLALAEEVIETLRVVRGPDWLALNREFGS